MTSPHFERSQEPEFSDEIPVLNDVTQDEYPRNFAEQAGLPERNRAYWADKLAEAVRERDELALEAIANGENPETSLNYNVALGRISIAQEEYEAYGAAEVEDDLKNLER